jgi:hypothetical protein
MRSIFFSPVENGLRPCEHPMGMPGFEFIHYHPGNPGEKTAEIG